MNHFSTLVHICDKHNVSVFNINRRVKGKKYGAARREICKTLVYKFNLSQTAVANLLKVSPQNVHQYLVYQVKG